MPIKRIISNQILISDPIINKVKEYQYNRMFLKKFKKIPKRSGNSINDEIRVKKCLDQNGSLVYSGYRLPRNIPPEYSPLKSLIQVRKCYYYDEEEKLKILKKNEKPVYYIIDGRHRMVSVILNKERNIYVEVLE